MHALIAVALYWARVVRRPIDARLKWRRIGGFLIIALGAALVRLWVNPKALPSNGLFWSEVLGVLAVYAFCWSLVLATRVRALEPWFGGLDRMYLWHRRTAIAGFLLLVAHVVLATTAGNRGVSRVGDALGVLALVGLSALVAVSLARIARLIRLAYEPWLLTHRAIGLFVAAAVVHGALVDPLLRASALLRVTYLAMGALGLLAYAYQELVARLVDRPAAYVVRRVERLAGETLDVTLAAVAAPFTARPGQFLLVSFGGADPSQRHPFSVAGVADDGSLRLSIQALGDYTHALYARLEAGTPARVSGPYGLFDYTLGGTRQVWIAAGGGVAPFLGWLRQPDGLAGRSIDFYYSVRAPADALYLDEIQAAATRAPGLRVHLIVTSKQGRLTVAHVQRHTTSRLADTHVFLCGPPAMTDSFARGLRRVDVPRDQVHFEHFAFR